MVFGKTSIELKVGLFVFIGLIILVSFVLLIGDFKTWTAGYPLKFTFNFINGVKLGAPVRFAGVDVGEVKEINFVFSDTEQRTKVEIVGWVKNKARIPVDSEVWVNTLGLLGEKYIEIMPGKDYSSFMVKNGVLIGHEPIAMHELADIAKRLVDNIDAAITNRDGTIGKLLYDPALYNELEGLVSDIRKNPWKLIWKTKEKK
jgi:phospholipid/cholesterol/gamma-HCH transport system substrate-binding protein